ncbi:MAG: hypothetical protein IPI65_13305 [Bacteroidetes bacterium]|nr:hypothetical protein [Bacteroidota bacterium]
MPRKFLLLTIPLLVNCMFLKAFGNNFVYFNEQSNQTDVYSGNLLQPDTLINVDSLTLDTITLNGNNLWYDLAPDALDALINYKGVDSIVYDLDSGKTYIYAKGKFLIRHFT